MATHYLFKSGTILALLLVHFCTIAQECSLIQGIIKDAQTREYLPGAHIKHLNKGIGVGSDSLGNFELNALVGDTLIISYVGYENRMIIIDECSISIALVPTSQNINEVVVNANRIISEEFSVRKINKLEIYTNPSAKADPILAVNAMPSATTTDESANISLRGGSPAETGIFLNDVPINDAVRFSQMNGIGNFSIFNTALIRQVQVYPGNPPLEYGNSTSGIIAIQTEEVIPEQPSSSVILSLAGLGLFTAKKLDKHSSLTAFSNAQSSALFGIVNNKALGDLKSFHSLDFGLHYFRNFKGNISLKLFNYSLLEGYQFNYRQPTNTGIFNQQKRRNFTVANLRKHFGKTTLHFNQGLSFSKATYRYSTMDMDLNLGDYFASVNVHHFGKEVEWKTGVNYLYQGADFRGTFPLYSYAYGEQFPTTRISSIQKINVPEGYAYIKRHAGRWILGAGVRQNLPIKEQEAYTSWQGNVSYQFGEKIKMIVSAGDYFKYSVSQEDMGKPVLYKTRQYSWDANFTGNSLDANFSLFYKKGTNNNVESDLKGAELFTRYKVTRNLNVQASFTRLDAMEKHNGAARPSPYNIHYFIKGNVEYKIQGIWTFSLVYQFRQGSYYFPLEGSSYNDQMRVYEPFYKAEPDRLPPYNMIDLSASKIFLVRKKASAVAFASVNNIMNFKNVREYSYNYNYNQRYEELFSKRVIYFGVMVSW